MFLTIGIKPTENCLIDKLLFYGIFNSEVKSVFGTVATIQTCGDWVVLFFPAKQISHESTFLAKGNI